MAQFSSAKLRFPPTLLERLFDDTSHLPSEANPLRRWGIDELKDSVARDLEVLLNSRAGLTEEDMALFPEAAHSVLSFGMTDFVGLSLASPADRSYICRTLERAILTHEPRLQQVHVGLEASQLTVNRLHFSISAVLVVHPMSEPVNFDALLQPSTFQYSVAKSRGVASSN